MITELDFCPRCRRPLVAGEAVGRSQLQQPDMPWLLCEACFYEEEAEIRARGTNALPGTLERYRVNRQAGPLMEGETRLVRGPDGVYRLPEALSARETESVIPCPAQMDCAWPACPPECPRRFRRSRKRRW